MEDDDEDEEPLLSKFANASALNDSSSNAKFGGLAAKEEVKEEDDVMEF